jgi:predicted small integral membrane protein
MATLNTYQIIRRSKVAITFMVGILGLLIVFSNLSDYNSNYVFVGHVLSMDTTGSHLMYRSIDSEIMHHRIYWMIMTLETIFTTSCLYGAYQLFNHINASAEAFHCAKKYAVLGFLTGLFVYYFCFQVIGNEWFDMDQSKDWNAMSWAQSIVNFLLPALIFLTIKNDN